MQQSAALWTSRSSRPTIDPLARVSRLNWVDTAKGLGIILVVVGHALRGLIQSNIMESTQTTRFVDAWIYAFHIPLFFFLSGLFLLKSTTRPWLEFAWDKIRVLAYPYFVWSTVTLMIKSQLGTVVNQPYGLSDVLLLLYKPIDQFWFLYVLFVLTLSISILLKLRVRPWAILIVAALVYPGALPISSYEGEVIVQARMMAIYFALGVVAADNIDVRNISNAKTGWLALSAIVGLMLPLLAGSPSLPYQESLRPILACGGIAGTIALAVLVDRIMGSVIQFLGRTHLKYTWRTRSARPGPELCSSILLTSLRRDRFLCSARWPASLFQ